CCSSSRLRAILAWSTWGSTGGGGSACTTGSGGGSGIGSGAGVGRATSWVIITVCGALAGASGDQLLYSAQAATPCSSTVAVAGSNQLPIRLLGCWGRGLV